MAASNRIRGVVLHDILSRVGRPSDLAGAVRSSVLSGDLTEAEAEEVSALLSVRISEVASMGWFPEGKGCVLNETSLIDTDGNIYRPDRVVLGDGKVLIIDYKFGEQDSRYLRQVRRYADIWRRMGYEKVYSFLWYVQTGDIVQA